MRRVGHRRAEVRERQGATPVRRSLGTDSNESMPYDTVLALDPRGADKRAKPRWWRKSTTKSSRSPTIR